MKLITRLNITVADIKECVLIAVVFTIVGFSESIVGYMDWWINN